MKVVNIHERPLAADMGQAGRLIDSLASKGDLLWPRRLWPPMVLDQPLTIGAAGGHGPIRYSVEAYQPGRSVRFRFTGPKGFDGYHGYELLSITNDRTVLRHEIKMTTRGLATISWPLLYRPLHDALIEDSFTRAQISLGLVPELQAWSPAVKFLRWLISRGKTRSQTKLTDDTGH